MKKIIRIFTYTCFLLSSLPALAHEELPGEYKDPRWSMLKCTARRNGTLWASFGHLMTSENDNVTYFAPEVVLFATADAPATRLLFRTDFKKSIEQVKIKVSNKKFSMAFEAPNQFSVMQKHNLTLLQYGDIKNAYVGNWALSEEGKPDIMDEVHCQIF